MRLINWNISAFNRNIEKALDSILSYNPDIICLQELPQSGLNYLQKFSEYNIVHSVDVMTKNGRSNAFLVILSKQKIIATGTYEYYSDKISSPFIKCSEKIFGRKKQHRSLYADISVNGEVVRVHNLHLSWPVGPATRIK